MNATGWDASFLNHNLPGFEMPGLQVLDYPVFEVPPFPGQAEIDKIFASIEDPDDQAQPERTLEEIAASLDEGEEELEVDEPSEHNPLAEQREIGVEAEIEEP